MKVLVLALAILAIGAVVAVVLVAIRIAKINSNSSASSCEPNLNYNEMRNYYCDDEEECTSIENRIYCELPNPIVGYYIGQDTPLGRGEVLKPLNSNTIFVKSGIYSEYEVPDTGNFKILVFPSNIMVSATGRLAELKCAGWGGIGVEVEDDYNGNITDLVNFLSDVKNVGLVSSLSVPNTGPESGPSKDWNYFYQTYADYVDVFIPRMIFNNVSTIYNAADPHGYITTINSEENLKVAAAIPTAASIQSSTAQFLNTTGYVIWTTTV